MHDIGRTQLEAEAEFGEAEFGELEFGELESPLGEMAELELTTELLEVSNEQELEQFLGKLISRAGGAARNFARSHTGRALGGVLRDAARKALPIVGRAVGSTVGGWAGRAIGGPYGRQIARRSGRFGAQVASGAGRLLGLELEGLSQEDREFEVARQFVRFASSAAKAAAATPAAGSPLAAARAAATAAAAQHAPGLVPLLQGRPAGPRPGGVHHARSGRWVRRGNSIVLIGA